MQSPIQILKLTTEGLVFETETFLTTLDKIGDKNIAILSVIGKQNTGKSLLLNYILRTIGNNISNKDTILQGFELNTCNQSSPNGIYMWSQPIIGSSEDGTELALLLFETRCNFDDKAQYHECGIIFAINLLLSSTVVLNINNNFSEDILEFVEKFAAFAQSLNNQPKSVLFERLVFLVRDWDNESECGFGVHDMCSPINNNYMKNIIIPNETQSNEQQSIRKRILSYFDNIICYLTPHPAKNISKLEFRGQIDLIDDDFIEKVEDFVAFSIENLEPKLIDGNNLSSFSAKHCFNKWKEFISNEKIISNSIEVNDKFIDENVNKMLDSSHERIDKLELEEDADISRCGFGCLNFLAGFCGSDKRKSSK